MLENMKKALDTWRRASSLSSLPCASEITFISPWAIPKSAKLRSAPREVIVIHKP
jgi:hypothetical protein